MQARKSTLALKPRADVTRSSKQGYQWPHKRTDVLQKCLRKCTHSYNSRNLDESFRGHLEIILFAKNGSMIEELFLRLLQILSNRRVLKRASIFHSVIVI